MKLHIRQFNVFIFAILFIGSAAWAQTFVGTVLAVQGDVKVLHIPQPGEHGPFAKLKGQQYVYHPAKLGEKLNPGEVILSGTNGKVRIVYPNGDTFFIGHSSSFVLPVVVNGSTARNVKIHDHANSMIKMFYGRFRALISKVGPRNRLRVVTPDAIAGVRGTDFFTRTNANIGTRLTVLRGAVAVRNVSDVHQVIMVKTGYSADSEIHSHAKPKLIETPRKELVKIHRESMLKLNKRALKTLPKPEQQELKQLNKKSFESVMTDIRNHNPALYRNLKQHGVKSVDQIDTEVVARLWRNAPARRIKKPTAKALESSGRHVYRRYYHPNPNRHGSKHAMPHHHR